MVALSSCTKLDVYPRCMCTPAPKYVPPLRVWLWANARAQVEASELDGPHETLLDNDSRVHVFSKAQSARARAPAVSRAEALTHARERSHTAHAVSRTDALRHPLTHAHARSHAHSY
eukprot:6189373-Pleurochrysis_carterae.AAC.6